MSLYCISEFAVSVNHAGPKAREDVAAILGASSWGVLKIHRKLDDDLFTPQEWAKNKYRLDMRKLRRIAAIEINVMDWLRVSSRVHRGDTLLIQYPLPMYPKVSMTALPFIRRMKKAGANIIMLIHDLETLRGYEDAKVEREFLSLADVLIAHNDRMRQYVLSKHYCESVVSIGMFDYLPDAERANDDAQRHGIDIAGNLFHGKAGYVYQLARAFPEIDFNLFGPNFTAGAPEERWYRGNFAAESLPNRLQGEFGLVWDGETLDGCSGDFGDYLRFNNPHKFSLYIAAGEPVIIWDQAALADCVEKERIGIVAPSLSEALQKVSQLSPSEKMQMRKNAQRIGQRIRSGYCTKTAVRHAIEMIS